MRFVASILCCLNYLIFNIHTVTPPSISFQIKKTISSVGNCSRLSPIPVNVTWCPRLSSRVDFQCTIDIPGQTPMITFNGTPFTASYIESFNTSNNGMYRCSFQNTCGTSMGGEINVQTFRKHMHCCHFWYDFSLIIPYRTS